MEEIVGNRGLVVLGSFVWDLGIRDLPDDKGREKNVACIACCICYSY